MVPSRRPRNTAEQIPKDPYNFDFLTVTASAGEPNRSCTSWKRRIENSEDLRAAITGW